jgi:hypothetical protein
MSYGKGPRQSDTRRNYADDALCLLSVKNQQTRRRRVATRDNQLGDIETQRQKLLWIQARKLTAQIIDTTIDDVLPYQ